MPRPKIALFHQQTAKGCEDPPWAATVHGHPQPVGGFLLGHRVYSLGDTPHVQPVPHRRKRAEGQAEPKGEILRQIPARNLAGAEGPDVNARGAYLLEDSMLDKGEVAAGQSADIVRLLDLRRGDRRELPDLE